MEKFLMKKIFVKPGIKWKRKTFFIKIKKSQ